MAASRAEELVAQLRRRIVDGTIALGEKLPSESELIAAHGVSRTVVREAIARLQAEGLVRTRRGAGSFALAPPSEPSGRLRPARTLEERTALLELRIAVETEASSLAAVRRLPQELEALAEELEQIRRDHGDPAAALEHDFAFHLGIATASRSVYLRELVEDLGPTMITMPRERLEVDAAASVPGAVDLEHRAILDALAAQDPLAAAAAMRSHLVGSRRRWLDSL